MGLDAICCRKLKSNLWCEAFSLHFLVSMREWFIFYFFKGGGGGVGVVEVAFMTPSK